MGSNEASQEGADWADLRDSEERLQLIADAATDYAFITFDPGGRVTSWSAGAETIFKLSATEMLGELADVIFTSEDRNAGVPAWEFGTAREKGCAPDERWHLRADGGLVFLNGSMRPLPRDGEGRERGFIKIARDETVQRRQAEELARIRVELEEREASLRSLNADLERRVHDEVAGRVEAETALRQAQKMEAIGQLTGGVAHDFNNLLTVIRSSADLLRRPDLPEEKRRRYLDAVADTADRAAKLTGQLLAFSRRQALKPEVFDAADRVRQIADMLRTVLGARIELSLNIGCDSCFVDADAGQFETALVNLAVNARDAMHGEGQLTIAVRERQGVPKVRGHGGAGGNFVTICVADTGSGIAEDHIRRIFEPFFTTKEVGKGTGLGLSQVYGFAKQSGGEIDVASAIGEGTTFTMFLPQVEPATGVPVMANCTPLTKGKGTVLIVEDNSAVGEFATQLLVDLGYEPTWATDAAKALEILASGKVFDVIFTDVVMPGLSGVELARRVREQYPTVPVVLTSGYSDQLVADGRHGFPVLNKPYSAEALARILRRAIAEA